MPVLRASSSSHSNVSVGRADHTPKVGQELNGQGLERRTYSGICGELYISVRTAT
jgi:hypothetical protein